MLSVKNFICLLLIFFNCLSFDKAWHDDRYPKKMAQMGNLKFDRYFAGSVSLLVL